MQVCPPLAIIPAKWQAGDEIDNLEKASFPLPCLGHLLIQFAFDCLQLLLHLCEARLLQAQLSVQFLLALLLALELLLIRLPLLSERTLEVPQALESMQRASVARWSL